MSIFENDYAELVIVAEDEWYSRKDERTTMCIYNTLWEIKENVSQPKNDTIERVYCQKFLSERENCHAEVLFITDNDLANKVRKKFIIAAENGDNDSGYAAGNGYHHSVVIRVFEEKHKIVKEFDDRSAADVTFVVNGEECKADRKNLACVSPVFNAMLYGQFAEGKQEKITLEGIDSVGIFKDFLLAVSPLRVQPNPSNVVALLNLAHQYDIPFLMRNCEDHLMRCCEISNADRILLAVKYGLESLKTRTMQQLSNGDLQKILKEKSDQLCEPGCRFLFDIIANRLTESSGSLAPRMIGLRKGDGGLGFTIVGGEDGEPIYVGHVLLGGVADLSGGIKKGDVLLRVGDIDLQGATHDQSVLTLKSIPPNSDVHLLVQYRPREYQQFEDKIIRRRTAMLAQLQH